MAKALNGLEVPLAWVRRETESPKAGRLSSLHEFLGEVPEFRRQRGFRHQLTKVLAVALVVPRVGLIPPVIPWHSFGPPVANLRQELACPRANGPVCISVINMKGGVGKTTIAALLARYASRRLGLNVLAVDLDPQANLSQAFMRDGYKCFLRDQAPSIVEIFGGYQPPTSKSAAPNTLGTLIYFPTSQANFSND